jgi:uncharacterized membrane protein YfcA
LLFGIAPGTAVGTDLLYAAITKSTGTLVHSSNHSVDWRITGKLAAGSVPAAVICLLFLSHAGLGAQKSSALISSVLGVALILTAITLVFRGLILEWSVRNIGEVSPGKTAVLTVITGAVLGVLVSLSSVGAGAIGVTALLILYPRLPTVRIVGSDIAHAVPLTLVAGIGHWLIGSVNFSLLASLLVGSIPGICIASYFAVRVPDRVLRPLLAGTLTLVGGKLLG